MKLALVCPSNLLYMPYVENYTSILDNLEVDYDLINWDRLIIEEQSELVYRDSKNGHQRGFIDYIKYSNFIKKNLIVNKYDKVIVFGIQLMFFLKKFLIRNYHDNYIIDIRDYNRIIKCFRINSLVDSSAFTVLSSSGYKVWLPRSNKYIINHNLNLGHTTSTEERLEFFQKKSYKISYIGTITNLDINIELINEFANSNEYTLTFVGDGLINKQLENYVSENSIRNVIVKGRYYRSMEEELYKSTDFVNMLLYGNNINNRTCLSNRLYKAAFYGKPLIAIRGTLIADIIEKYNLGLVVNSVDDLKSKLSMYTINFQVNKYEEGRLTFLDEVFADNYAFSDKINHFTT